MSRIAADAARAALRSVHFEFSSMAGDAAGDLTRVTTGSAPQEFKDTYSATMTDLLNIMRNTPGDINHRRDALYAAYENYFVLGGDADKARARVAAGTAPEQFKTTFTDTLDAIIDVVARPL